MAAFWRHMAGRYGRKWYEEYGRSIRENDAWRKSLETMTPQEVRAGLKVLAADESIMGMPSLTQFEQCVLRALGVNIPRAPVYKKLEEPKAVRSQRGRKANEWANDLKRKLEGGK